MVDPGRGGRFSFVDRGRGFQSRIQCQICGRFGNLAQRCYYYFNCDYGSASAPAMAPFRSAGHGSLDETFGELGWWSLAYGVLVSLGGCGGLILFGGLGRCIVPSVVSQWRTHLALRGEICKIMFLCRLDRKSVV